MRSKCVSQSQALFKQCPLLEVLVDKHSAMQFGMPEWDLLIRQARSADMLASLYFHLSDLIASLPESAIRHLRWAHLVTLRHKKSIVQEVSILRDSLEPLDEPLILLKGAAYCVAKLSPSEGRIFSDIDILLPKPALPRAERLLERAGWLSMDTDEYDQYYYRQWMHELPPLIHGQRKTQLDVHHAIVPETARVKPVSEKMLSEIVAIDAEQNIFRLSDVDMILHSATHLFFDGEMQHGLRDLYDIDRLMREFCTTEQAWNALIERSREQDLVYPLYFAMHYCHFWLRTPVPDQVLSRMPCPVSPLKRRLMLKLFDRGLLPDHSSCYDQWTALSRWLLYVRSHYIKMPLHLLIPHLTYKSVIAPLKKFLKERKQEKGISLEKLLFDKKAEK